MKFKELSKNKNTIMSKIINDTEILKALTNPDEDFLNQDLSCDPISVIYKNLFPYRYVPDTTSTSQCYITMSFGRYKKVLNHYRAGYLTFYIFCNKNIVKTSEGWLRYDFIAHKIDELFEGNEELGMGKMQFENMDDLLVNDDYVGLQISYKTMQFK